MEALGDDPDQEQDVGDEVDGLHNGEYTPQRVDHAEGCCEQGGYYRDTLCTGRDGVDLWDGVAAGELCGLVFEPECHLAVGVG